MSFIIGNNKDTWHPLITADTTMAGYWLNWRFFLCAIWVLISMSIALLLIWKRENGLKRQDDKVEPGTEEEKLYDDESWRPCLEGIHPTWLLAFRVSAFVALLLLLILVVLVDGASIFYYYTQWTFTSVTLYFLLGSILSVKGCYQYHKNAGGDKVDSVGVDAEQGSYVNPEIGRGSNASSNAARCLESHRSHDTRKPAGKWGFIFQVMFQMNAGAVMLTDCVFWFILVPFLAIKKYHLSALVIGMHTLNAIFLLGDTALNSLKFPWFRIAYFYLWTITYVLFQWILHVFFKLWWPYPFLDLSSPYAPLWYLCVAAMHIPCYGLFAFITRLKHKCFQRWFPNSYQR